MKIKRGWELFAAAIEVAIMAAVAVFPSSPDSLLEEGGFKPSVRQQSTASTGSSRCCYSF
jgi:hypothetical protein